MVDNSNSNASSPVDYVMPPRLNTTPPSSFEPPTSTSPIDRPPKLIPPVQPEIQQQNEIIDIKSEIDPIEYQQVPPPPPEPTPPTQQQPIPPQQLTTPSSQTQTPQMAAPLNVPVVSI